MRIRLLRPPPITVHLNRDYRVELQWMPGTGWRLLASRSIDQSDHNIRPRPRVSCQRSEPIGCAARQAHRQRHRARLALGGCLVAAGKRSPAGFGFAGAHGATSVGGCGSGIQYVGVEQSAQSSAPHQSPMMSSQYPIEIECPSHVRIFVPSRGAVAIGCQPAAGASVLLLMVVCVAPRGGAVADDQDAATTTRRLLRQRLSAG